MKISITKKGSFDTDKIMKSLMHEIATKHKITIDCQKCGLFIWKYTAKELRENSELLCNNCGTTNNVIVDEKLK